MDTYRDEANLWMSHWLSQSKLERNRINEKEYRAKKCAQPLMSDVRLETSLLSPP